MIQHICHFYSIVEIETKIELTNNVKIGFQ